MKRVTELAYPERSEFLKPCLEAIKNHRGDLNAGRVIQVTLPPRGYNRRAIAFIDAGDAKYFWIDKKSDPTRFAARIRAAALALHTSGCFGEFDIAHETGVLTIRKLD